MSFDRICRSGNTLVDLDGLPVRKTRISSLESLRNFIREQGLGFIDARCIMKEFKVAGYVVIEEGYL